MMAEPVIEVKGITKRFKVLRDKLHPDGIFTALEDVSFSVASGECVVIGGANGSGKSLLMSIIAGLNTASNGTVRRTGPVGLVFQDADTQILGETPREDIAIGPNNQKRTKDECRRRTEAALKAMSLEDKADFPARSLSGGEKRRLAAAGILAMDTQVFIFDEPFANLDLNGVRHVTTMLRQLRNDGKTILILTHELEKCLALADRLLVLYKGRMTFDGTPSDGLQMHLEDWGIRNPLQSYNRLEDLIWN